MAQQYGTVKVDFITFTSGTTGNETDITIPVSGLADIAESGINISGDITGRNITATGNLSVSGQAFFASGIEAAPSITFTGDTNTGLYSPGANQVALSTNGTGRLFVDASGNVGIGAKPSSNLWIRGFATTATISSSTNTSNLDIINSTQTTRLGAVNADFAISHAGSERLRITSAGLVGIGTSAPVDSLLAIAVPAPGLSGDTTFGGGQTTATNSFRTFEWGLRVTGEASPSLNARAAINFRLDPGTGGSDSSIRFITNKYGASRAERMIITSTGNVGIGTTTPSGLIHGYINANAQLIFQNSNQNNLYVSGTNATVVADAIGSSFPGFTVKVAGTTVGQFTASGTSSLEIASGTSSMPILFRQSTSERARIDSSGRLLVGTSSDLGTSGLLQVKSSSPASGATLYREVDDNAGIRLNFAKSRGSTTSIVANNDSLGTIRFVGCDGADVTTRAAEIEAFVDGTPGANDMPGRLVFSTTADGASSPTERMRITSGGRVGIGLTDPDGTLHVSGSNAQIRLTPTNDTTQTARVIFTSTDRSTNSSISSGGLLGQDIAFRTNAERMRITTNGNVGIGTTSPSSKLDVNGSLSKTSGSFKIDHPLPELNETHHLVHSFVEAPDASNLYAGMVQLTDGVAVVNIDTAHRMTQGTFEALNTPQSWSSSNESGYAPVKSSLSGNLLTIECQDQTSDDTVYYEVRGIRKDNHMIETEWTDDNGRVITEPLK